MSLALSLAACSLLAGCSVWTGSAFEERKLPPHTQIQGAPASQPLRGATVASGVVSSPAVVERLTVQVESFKGEPPPAEYHVGPNDNLFINVFGMPELSSSPLLTGGSRIIGSRVDGAGYIQLPLVRTVQVGGLTAREIQEKIREAFVKFVPDTWAVVEVVEHRSQPIYLVGQFRSPGVEYLDRPTNLLQALAMGGGMAAGADLRGARVQRSGQVLPVDIYRLLHEGDVQQNIWIKAGDTIYIPDAEELQVFVFGSVDKPGPMPMVRGKLNLTQALSAAGVVIKPGSATQHIRIIRSISPTRGELIVVDLQKMLTGESLPFELQPGDIVYVPRSRLGNWNDTLREILPTLQTVSSIIQPFALIAAAANND